VTAPVFNKFRVLTGGRLRYAGRHLNDADRWAGHSRRATGQLWERLRERPIATTGPADRVASTEEAAVAFNRLAVRHSEVLRRLAD
jgi:hypothetical protein